MNVVNTINNEIMSEIEKNFSNFEGWDFYREFHFDQFKKGDYSITVLIEDGELGLQLYLNDDNIDATCEALDNFTVEIVLEKVKEMMMTIK